jgi:arylsulfatase
MTVSEEDKAPGTFNGGTTLGVAVDVSPELDSDREIEAIRALKRT